MNNHELALELDRLEQLLEEVLQLVNDPDISDRELRKQVRALVEEFDDAE